MKNIELVYFSPTGNTRKTMHAIVKGISPTTCHEHDLTLSDRSQVPLSFSKDDFVLIGCPVYAGRIPSKPENIFSHLEGDDTPIVLIVTYGNRAYDDALLELQNLAIEKGFIPVAAGAFLAEHSYSKKLAGGRPDADDLQMMWDFGRTIREDYLGLTDYNGTLIVKGNTPYCKGMVYTPLSPEVNDLCTKCGDCVAVCPVDAIDSDRLDFTDPQKCIRCCACIKICPESARHFTATDFVNKVSFLEQHFSTTYKKPEFFYIQ